MPEHRPLELERWQYENDDELMAAYREYLYDFDEWKAESESILYADDLETWLEFNRVGHEHAERVEREEAER